MVECIKMFVKDWCWLINDVVLYVFKYGLGLVEGVQLFVEIMFDIDIVVFSGYWDVVEWVVFYEVVQVLLVVLFSQLVVMFEDIFGDQLEYFVDCFQCGVGQIVLSMCGLCVLVIVGRLFGRLSSCCWVSQVNVIVLR